MQTLDAQDGRSRRLTRFFAWCAIAALIWTILARVFGPSDLWAYTQFKTVSYTTDIVLNGGQQWILPRYCGIQQATKPPLYNWLAVPNVTVIGFGSELAHKFPSLVALCVCWLLTVRLGRAIDPHAGGALGWVAGMIIVANYTIFKLGYVARPDMLLTLWLFIAWMASTSTFISHSRQSNGAGNNVSWFAAIFWSAIALAFLTKGPAAFVGLAHAVIAARVVAGSWWAFAVLRPIIGLASLFAIAGAWTYAVWRIDPQHLSQVLWGSEFVGRLQGENTDWWIETDPWRLITTLHYHPLYFISRFAPWSIFAIAAMVALFRKGATSKANQSIANNHDASRLFGWLRSGALMIIVVICFFSLSAGKRADYLAAAYPPAAILAAWWLLYGSAPLRRRLWITPALAVITLTAITAAAVVQQAAPSRHYGRTVKDFIDQANAIIEAESRPVAFFVGDQTYVQAMMGFNDFDGRDAVTGLLGRGEACWIIALRKEWEEDWTPWLSQQGNGVRMKAEVALRSDEFIVQGPHIAHYYLYRIEPVVRSKSSDQKNRSSQ